MTTRPNWRACALSLSSLLLSACAGQPLVCPQPQPLPADLAQPFPPPGWFQAELERILSQGQTSDPNSAP